MNISKRTSRSKKKSKSPSKNVIVLKKSTHPDKKFMVIIDNKTVHFGAKGYSDYTYHKDTERMHRYENRHKRKEDWKR